ncbi:hypothetical protein PCI56_01570 [Plesiomonas shigelloides subsp. oncorhynchi]|nr:hypothetical protein [Plesiomonas shigelloides]
MLGSTFNFVFETQMEMLQDGDRFYYLSRTQGLNLLNELEANSFTALVMRNSDLGQDGSSHLPAHLFQTPDHIFEVNRALQTEADPLGVMPSKICCSLCWFVVRPPRMLTAMGPRMALT